jgi:fructose-bisphosphate aldolase, class II
MPLTSTAEIIATARAAGGGAGAFNVIGIEHAEAIVAGAEKAGAAVVLQVSENCVAYHGALAAIGRAVLAAADAATVPTAAHLDHATSADLIYEAVELGFGSVMFDGSALPYPENVRETARIAAWCHDRGICVEAELGEVGGKNGVHAAGARTDPGEAADFVCATSVDMLAVAVGSSHAMVTRDAVLDLDLVRRIRAAVPLDAAVRAGLTKINIATQLNKVFTSAVRGYLTGDDAVTDPRHYLAAGREAVATEVARLLGVLRADAGSRV